MRLALALFLLSACVPLLRRHGGVRSDQVELMTRSTSTEDGRGRVRYLKAGPGSVDPTLNRAYAEDEMVLACPSGRWKVDFESEEMGATGFGQSLVWQVLTFSCTR